MNDNAQQLPTEVKSWVRSELVLRQDLPEGRLCEVCIVEDDDTFYTSYLSV